MKKEAAIRDRQAIRKPASWRGGSHHFSSSERQAPRAPCPSDGRLDQEYCEQRGRDATGAQERWSSLRRPRGTTRQCRPSLQPRSRRSRSGWSNQRHRNRQHPGRKPPSRHPLKSRSRLARARTCPRDDRPLFLSAQPVRQGSSPPWGRYRDPDLEAKPRRYG